MNALTWVGIFLCIAQAGVLSGLNLALFSISRLRLEVEAAAGNSQAQKILEMRHDANFLLATILWANVSVNVLLTLLSDLVLLGAGAFFFSTFIITIFGEITPQAYFSRHALRLGSLLAPMLKFYSMLLYPVAKPSAILLDAWLGREGIQFFREKNMREVIRKHIKAEESDIDRIEGIGVLNFLAFDDLLASQEGEPVDPDSIIRLPLLNGQPVFPSYDISVNDPFLKRVHASGKKWVIIVCPKDDPQLVLNANAFLRSVFLENKPYSPFLFCHRPILVSDPKTLIGNVISRLKVSAVDYSDDVIDNDLILIWCKQKRVITGSDILGRLLRGIVVRQFHST